MSVNRFDSNYNRRETPVFFYAPVAIQDHQRAEVEQLIAKAKQALIPAAKQEFIQELGRLMLHKGIGNYSESQWKLMIEDYTEDLGHYPLDIIKDACKTCRRDPEMKFFPQIGRLEQLMKWPYLVRKIQTQRLCEMLDKCN